MDLSRAVYSRDLKITTMRALDAGSARRRNCAEISTEPETAGALARGVARQGRTGVSRQWAARRRYAGAGRCPAHRRAGAQNRPAHHGERFFKKSLAAFQGSSPASRRQWRGCLFEEIEQAAAKGQAVNALCQMTGLSRAGFYRWRRAAPGHSGGDGTARSDAEGRLGIAGVRIPENHGGAAAAGLRGQPQTRAADDARGQSAVRAAARLRGHRPTRGTTCRFIRTWRATSRRRRSTSSGWPTSPTSGCVPSSCTWRWCWMPSRGA